ncbi:hypothetical protein DFQ27_007948 [Actinomortierella ambigua]|uniref:Uncharacterized protein n=1 Tax=Actinomortierella ambigua TaxID=1343610 RepID=A0A9P6PTM5_9FUNG|nr:hypothetical protein DFQ27_007948 [Actinomortierella ambigua]
MLMKLLTFLVALLFLMSPAEACAYACRRDGPFRDAQVAGTMSTRNFNGAIVFAKFDWRFKHTQNNYEGGLSYIPNLFKESKTHCSSDGAFCINDRLYIGGERQFGYTLYFNGECSNYWGRFSQRGRCPVAPKTTTSCTWDKSMNYVSC